MTYFIYLYVKDKKIKFLNFGLETGDETDSVGLGTGW